LEKAQSKEEEEENVMATPIQSNSAPRQARARRKQAGSTEGERSYGNYSVVIV